MVQQRDNGLCLPFCPPALSLMPDTSVPSCMPLVPFKLLPMLGLRGSESEKVIAYVGSLRVTEALAVSSTDPIPAGFCSQRLWDLPSWHGTLGWGAWCGAGTPRSQGIAPKFPSTTRGYGTSPFHISPPPSILDGCGFFNTIVFRLLFNSISHGFE